MVIEPGEFLASGRAADVFDQGDGTVLRRYRTDHNTEAEARLMSWVAASGFPVPEVHEAEGTDIVMERISGPTMLEDIQRKPWTMVGHALTMAALQRELNALVAPDWLETDRLIPSGRMLLHLDFHPMNVILGPAGPVVIDWTNARRGQGGFDAALSYVLMTAFEPDNLKDTIGQWALTRLFRLRRGRRTVDGFLAAAATYRLDDPNVTPGERRAIEKMLGAGGGAGAGPGAAGGADRTG